MNTSTSELHRSGRGLVERRLSSKSGLRPDPLKEGKPTQRRKPHSKAATLLGSAPPADSRLDPSRFAPKDHPQGSRCSMKQLI
mmetsp:Transcript_23096/g.82497  ORF Transcript_23096/g.82497 Transcript_23096/m.82497 type:complete len:83 (-) Transcript_23096:250-498(-)